MICAFVFRIWKNTGFLMTRLWSYVTSTRPYWYRVDSTLILHIHRYVYKPPSSEIRYLDTCLKLRLTTYIAAKSLARPRGYAGLPASEPSPFAYLISNFFFTWAGLNRKYQLTWSDNWLTVKTVQSSWWNDINIPAQNNTRAFDAV